MNCAEVCPKGLEPVHAIERIRLKIAGAVDAAGGLNVHPPKSPK
jgi:succinate dehydrogenase / fumarate reductase iron-sulfur subunit